MCADHDIDDDYLRGVGQQMFRSEDIELADLSREQLIRILGEMKRFVRRRLKREEASAAVAVEPSEPEIETVEEPF